MGGETAAIAAAASIHRNDAAGQFMGISFRVARRPTLRGGETRRNVSGACQWNRDRPKLITKQD
jgi:hypothetical protein